MNYMAVLPEFRSTPVELIKQRQAMVLTHVRKEMKVKGLLRQFNITRPDFYKYLHRFNQYGVIGLQNIKRGSKNPHNKTGTKDEENIVSLHHTYPFFSSYELNELTGLEPRTIQRIMNRRQLKKIYKPKHIKKKLLKKLKMGIQKEKREKRLKKEF